MNRLFLVLVSLACIFAQMQQNSNIGAPLWVKHVTASRKVSIWTNKAQLEEEALKPTLPSNETHPWALQTRWDLTQNVAGAPDGTQFVCIEMGSTPFCGTDSCSDTIVLFGLTTASHGDTFLRSYKSKVLSRLVNALHKNATSTEPLIHFREMNADNVTVRYKFYAQNESFYGVGGGNTPDGGRIEVRELVSHNLVAPLEVFYTADGHEETEYVTPLRYHHADEPTITDIVATKRVNPVDSKPQF